MTRYIDADAIEKVLEEKHFKRPLDSDRWLIADIKKSIMDLPTIDAVPVKRGKWIIRDNPGTGWYRVTCSECGEDVTATAPCIGFFPNAKVNWNYCPECGADMRGNETS